ncbi:major facilitator superfamily domain-containing protein [Pestalotiopsis sp. NC0098]|nr:major facilitator superfamily domain-containing protein [Pestalotiopsis sp. NC0098]
MALNGPESGPEAETRALLQDEWPDDPAIRRDAAMAPVSREISPGYVLPVALLAALAMASTAATAYVAYAQLLCRGPANCGGDEVAKYASFVAVAQGAANILGLSALGYLRRLMAKNRRVGLIMWMFCRSLSAVMLLLGVLADNIYVALSGRLFEGLASDNLLHFTLNAVYVQSPDQEKASSWISQSLALYMIGISVSPFVVGFFADFTISFFVAIGLFAFSIVYLLCCKTDTISRRHITANEMSTGGDDEVVFLEFLRKQLRTIISPLDAFKKQPKHLLIGLSLFAFNVTQSYIFSALLVYTTSRLGFGASQNGYIISIVHSVAALYIFIQLGIAPRIARYFRPRQAPQTPANVARRDLILAVVSLAIYILSLVALGFAHQAWQIYSIAVFLAVGLPTPSFTKAYFVALFADEEKSGALVALTTLEMVASILGPVLIGGLQSQFAANSVIFFVAAGLGGISLGLLAMHTLCVSR